MGQGAVSTDVNDEVGAFPIWGQFLGFHAPVGRGAVVESVVGAKVFEALFFGFGAGGCDDGRAGCDGKLEDSVSAIAH